MSLRLCERLNAVFDRVFGPPAELPDPTHSWEDSKTTTTAAMWASKVTIICSLCGDAYSGSPAEAQTGIIGPLNWGPAHCAPCRRAKTIERDHERANWRRRREALIASVERRTDGA